MSFQFPAINLSAIKPAEPIPDAIYHLKIVEANPGMSESGNPKIDLKLEIQDNPDFEGRTFYDTITFTVNDPSNYAMQKAKAFLVVMGFDPDDESAQINPELWLGEIVAGRVKTNLKTKVNPATGTPYAPRPQVNEYMPYGSAPSVAGMIALEEEEE
jgi:hypothetical protein